MSRACTARRATAISGIQRRRAGHRWRRNFAKSNPLRTAPKPVRRRPANPRCGLNARLAVSEKPNGIGPKKRETGISGGKMGLFCPVFRVFGVPRNNFAPDARVFQQTADPADSAGRRPIGMRKRGHFSIVAAP